jgi:hypothetical protein
MEEKFTISINFQKLKGTIHMEIGMDSDKLIGMHNSCKNRDVSIVDKVQNIWPRYERCLHDEKNCNDHD